MTESSGNFKRNFVVGLVVVFTLFWIWVLFIVPPAPEDTLHSKAFPTAAQPVCTNVLNDLDASHLLNQPAATPAERADLVERQDAKLAALVQQLRSLTPTTGDDAHAVSTWLDDWDQWLRDRATWVTKLRAGQDVSFDEKADVNGDPNSKALNAFAVTNAMPACATPFGV